MDTKILVIHPGSLGDVVLSLPALDALKRAYPMAGLDLIGNPSILELLRGRFYADHVISIDRADVTSCLTGLEDLSGPWLDTLKEYSLIVNWLGDTTEGFIRRMRHIGVQIIVTSRPISKKTIQQHRINIFLESLFPLQIPTPFSHPQVFPCPEDRKLGQEALLSLGIVIQERPVLAIHPGSGGRYKCWDFTRFIEVSHQASEHLGFQSLFILGPAERGLGQKFKNSLGHDVAVLDSVPLPILAGALTWCRMFLGNDSGVTHLAAALGIPTAAIFGPTDPHLWGPVGQHVRIISKRTEGGQCSPTSGLASGGLGCGGIGGPVLALSAQAPTYEGQSICQECGCLDLVSVEDVIQTLAEAALDYSATIC